MSLQLASASLPVKLHVPFVQLVERVNIFPPPLLNSPSAARKAPEEEQEKQAEKEKVIIEE